MSKQPITGEKTSNTNLNRIVLDLLKGFSRSFEFQFLFLILPLISYEVILSNPGSDQTLGISIVLLSGLLIPILTKFNINLKYWINIFIKIGHSLILFLIGALLGLGLDKTDVSTYIVIGFMIISGITIVFLGRFSFDEYHPKETSTDNSKNLYYILGKIIPWLIYGIVLFILSISVIELNSKKIEKAFMFSSAIIMLLSICAELLLEDTKILKDKKKNKEKKEIEEQKDIEEQKEIEKNNKIEKRNETEELFEPKKQNELLYLKILQNRIRIFYLGLSIAISGINIYYPLANWESDNPPIMLILTIFLIPFGYMLSNRLKTISPKGIEIFGFSLISINIIWLAVFAILTKRPIVFEENQWLYFVILGIGYGILIDQLIQEIEGFIIKTNNKKIKKYENRKNIPPRSFIWTYIISIFMILSGALSVTVYFMFKDNNIINDYFAWPILLISSILTLIFLISNAFSAATFSKLKKKKNNMSSSILISLSNLIEKVEGINFKLIKQKTIKICLISVLSLIIIFPTFILLLENNSNNHVLIKLNKTMYDVNGEAINEITLDAATGKILLYNPPNFTHNPLPAGNGMIRPNKSIRLGAYFYGLGGSTVEELINFIGHNLDVYSLGMCGATVKPENITQIKELNPFSKFYYMAFATTLYEDTSGKQSGSTWGDTHYPLVTFNATMHDWTVKYNNGTEAIGVRRKSPDSNAHLMDLGKKEWADYFAWIYSNRTKQFHADGVAIDEVMWNGYWDTDINELRDYNSVNEIRETCYDWLKELHTQANARGMEIMTQAFWNDVQPYQDGIWGEISFRSGGQYGDRVDDRYQTVWYEKMNWEEIVNNMYDFSLNNRSYIWAAWYERNNDEALEYAISTYLMGKPNDYYYLGFHPQPIYDGGYPNNLAGYSIKTVMEELENQAKYFDLEMGNALRKMHLEKGIGGSYWIREFENGIVLVNPFHARIPGFEGMVTKDAASH